MGYSMATVIPQGIAPDDALVELADRFDRDVIDLPHGRARVRLDVVDGASFDAVIAGPRVRLGRPNESAEPDAVLSADSATWKRIAADVRGGMDAFRAGRL